MNDSMNDWNLIEDESSKTEPFLAQENTSQEFVPPVVSFNTPSTSPVSVPVYGYGNMTPIVPNPITEPVQVIQSLSTEPYVPETEAPPMINPVLPNSNVVKMEHLDSDVRYNPVTGEEVSLKEIMAPKGTEPEEKGEDKKARRGEIKQKVRSTWNSLLLILLFFFLIVFVLFLPEVQTKVDNFLSGKQESIVENIPSGKLVCTLSTNTVNLDRNIERIFQYENNKLKSGKYTTTVRGDITLDESALDNLYDQCSKVKDGVNGLSGVEVSCSYDAGKLVEKETFDYQSYSVEEVSNAYFNAGSSLLELTYDEDIDKIMVLMRQGGFTCNKEK